MVWGIILFRGFCLENWSVNGRFVSYYFEHAADRVIDNDKATVAKLQT